MCGIAGIVRWDGRASDRPLLKRMAQTLVHRGPDDEGFYFSENQNPTSSIHCGLGFRRLSIIDLASGQQPMTTKEKRFWIVFNGEIYNFKELRADLEKKGCQFLTRSDTEVILHLYTLYGKECVQYLRGMFSFAIWDSKEKNLFLARDRVGKKPFFYAHTHSSFYFASEIKALLPAEEISKEINMESIPLYLAYQYIPGPQTIFKEILRVPPGHTLLCRANGKIEIERYWKVSRTPKLTGSIQDICEELRHHLRESTKLRLVSDVPLGAFLSGGIDSSAVVGMMAQEMSQPVKTFSIGFKEDDFSELSYAKMVADRFKTDHHEFLVQPLNADILPKLAYNYDQPFADPSALPSFFVSQQAKQFVTVALNGDGGDENFGGYLRYQVDRIFYTLSKIPAPLRVLISSSLKKIHSQMGDIPLLGLLARAGGALGASAGEFNFHLFSYNYFCSTPPYNNDPIFAEPLQRAAQKQNVYHHFEALYSESDSEEFLDQVLACDLHGYLADCLLVKMDIASMANSLETRSPFLDHKLIEFAARIPSQYKVKWGSTKWILKEALKDFLPKEILHRKKKGFGIPLARWFRGPLKEFLRETILSGAAKQRGYFKMAEVERLIQEHESGKRDHGYRLWSLLMFELWHRGN